MSPSTMIVVTLAKSGRRRSVDLEHVDYVVEDSLTGTYEDPVDCTFIKFNDETKEDWVRVKDDFQTLHEQLEDHRIQRSTPKMYTEVCS